jgi:hypothetical protein
MAKKLGSTNCSKLLSRSIHLSSLLNPTPTYTLSSSGSVINLLFVKYHALGANNLKLPTFGICVEHYEDGSSNADEQVNLGMNHGRSPVVLSNAKLSFI